MARASSRQARFQPCILHKVYLRYNIQIRESYTVFKKTVRSQGVMQGRVRDSGPALVHSKFEFSLGYVRTCLEKLETERRHSE